MFEDWFKVDELQVVMDMNECMNRTAKKMERYEDRGVL